MAPDYPVILAANRDESRARPSSDHHRWAGAPAVWAGRDDVAGGTWLGVNEHGLVAAITNRPRDGAVDPNRPSRGHLCVDALRRPSVADARQVLRDLVQTTPQNPFNLLCASPSEAWALTSRGDQFTLDPGLHILTNQGDPDDMAPPKAQRAFAQMGSLSIASAGLDDIVAFLAAICRNCDEPGPICVAGGERGTVSSSIIAVRGDGSTAAYRHAAGPPCEPAHPYVAMKLDAEEHRTGARHSVPIAGI